MMSDVPRTVFDAYCPMGCGKTVMFVDGYLHCSKDDCANPSAANDILAEPETEHLVVFTDGGFTVKHPLRERLNDDLLRCTLHDEVVQSTALPALKVSGTYRARWDGEDWLWWPPEEPIHSEPTL